MDLWALGKNPVSSDQAAGSDISYDPEFEQLQAEVNKLSLRDWEKVVQMASGLLANKSKDLWVASTLAVALLHTRQAEGLAIGLRVYRDLLTGFWDTLYPPKERIRKRLRTIEWWVEKTGSSLKSLETLSVSSEQLEQVKEDFDAIDGLLKEHLEQAPSTASIKEFLGTLTPGAAPAPESELEGQALPKKAPEAEPQPSTQKTEAVEERRVSRPKEEEAVEGIAATQEAQRELKAGLQKIRRVAAYFWQEDVSSPLVYRLNRIAAWLQVQELPRAMDGRTRVPPPDGQVQKALSGLREKGDWENTLKAAEPKISQFPLWLDLNHYVSEALRHLGTQYEAAENTVCEETALLVHRLPGVENLTFSDGTPFADSETKGWLREIALGGESSREALPILPVASEPSKESDPIQSEMGHAQTLLKEGRVFEAVDLLQKQLQSSFSRKERLLWRLALAQLLIHSKNTKLVLPHLEEIFRDIDHYQLEEWDPALALNALKVVWSILNVQKDQTAKERAAEVLNRIAKLDLKEAIDLEGGRSSGKRKI